MSPERQEQFITHLSTKYGNQFTNEPRFTQFIKEQFKLEENKNTVATYAHVFKFSGLTQIRELIELQEKESKASNARFFATKSPADEQQNEANIENLQFKKPNA